MDNNVQDIRPRKKKRITKREHYRRVVRRMWRCFFAFMAFMLLVFVLIYNGIIGYMPPISELKNPTDRFASTLYTADGKEMGRLFKDKSNRVYVDYDQISKHLTDALIATEDARFMEHSGIDLRGLGRAIVKRVGMGQSSAGGGSTITQQLAKQLYSPKSENIFQRALQKPIEWVIAVKLERYYTKDEIIKMYFNQFDFLNNAAGIKSASFVYFGKDPKDLNVQEAALLVGMCKNPSYYNPLRYPDRAKERRNMVFDLMVKNGSLQASEAQKLKQLPVELSYHKVNKFEGLAPYFREELRRMMMANEPKIKDYPTWDRHRYHTDSIQWADNPLYGWCNKNHKSNGDPYDVYTDGLKIYTTIDSRMQQHLEDAVRDYMSSLQSRFLSERGGTQNPYYGSDNRLKQALIKRAIKQSERYQQLKRQGLSDNEIMSNFNQKKEMKLFSYNGEVVKVMSPLDSLIYTKSFLRCGVMTMDPTTGYIKAYVGGPNYDHFKYDMVSTGRRQIGSTVKPFLYSLAVENGLTPCDQVSNATISIGGWSPRGGGGGGTVTLKHALTTSNNTVSAHLVDMFKPDNLVYIMRNFGITDSLAAVPALCLGACDVSVREMVGAYSTFANKGMRSEPLFVTKITDNDGNVLAEFAPQQTEVISENSCYKMLSMLRSVVDHGTGSRMRGYGVSAPMGGKTGTTNASSDGWFMGFTPDLVTGVWVGGEERFIHFGSSQGAELALPILAKFLVKVFNDPALPYSQDTKFDVPESFNECSSEYGNSRYDDGSYSGSYRRRSGGGGGGNGNNGGGGGGEASHASQQSSVMEGVFD